LGPRLHPRLAALDQGKVANLQTELNLPELREEASAGLHSLIDAILVYSGERRGEISVELRGDLAAFLHLRDTGAQTGTAAAQKGNGLR
jgi:hypothetical protein